MGCHLPVCRWFDRPSAPAHWGGGPILGLLQEDGKGKWRLDKKLGWVLEVGETTPTDGC